MIGTYTSNPNNLNIPALNLTNLAFTTCGLTCADEPPLFKLKSLEGELASLVKALDHSALIAEKFSQLMKATREWIFLEIASWLQDPSSSTVFWLAGGGGTGKSVISATLLHRLPGLGGIPLAWYTCLLPTHVFICVRVRALVRVSR